MKGRENVPAKGGALLVPNHVSFVDGLFLLATVDRPIRFLVESAYFHHRLLKPFMKAMRAIPIASSGGPKVVLYDYGSTFSFPPEHRIALLKLIEITSTRRGDPYKLLAALGFNEDLMLPIRAKLAALCSVILEPFSVPLLAFLAGASLQDLHWESDLAVARKKAADEGKPLLIVFR